MSRMSGKIVLITGAASGLGKADALKLAQEGATVVLTDIDDGGQAIAAKISESTGQQNWQRPTPGGNAEITYYLTAEQAAAAQPAAE